MRICLIFAIAFLCLFLAGCACEEMPAEEAPPAEDDVQDGVDVQEQEAQEEGIGEADEANESGAEETPVEEKQLALGSTTITEEEVTMASDIVCRFEEDAPKEFSFSITNIEEKEWVFDTVSYADQDEYSHPIVVLNALQVTDAQMIKACGKKRISPDESVNCVFDVVNDMRVRTSLRTGLTPLGNENKNILSVRTGGHAIELKFLCE